MTAIKRTITQEDLDNSRRLKQLYKDRKNDLQLTQVKLSEHLGVTQGFIAQLMNGFVSMNTDTVLKLAAILQCDPEDIAPEVGRVLRARKLNLDKTKVPVMFTLSGRPPQHLNATITTPEKTVGTECYIGIEIDTDDYEPACMKGGMIVIDGNQDPEPGTQVIVILGDSSVIPGVLKKSNSQTVTIVDFNKQRREIEQRHVRRINPIVQINTTYTPA